jgi:hypothetical protein
LRPHDLPDAVPTRDHLTRDHLTRDPRKRM